MSIPAQYLYGMGYRGYGYFVFTEFGPSQARLFSTPATPYSARARCLTFWYYMKGECGQLNIYVHTVEGSKTLGITCMLKISFYVLPHMPNMDDFAG